MRHVFLLPIGLLAVCSGMPASAQLQFEQADGLDRVCIYAGNPNVTSEVLQRTYRIGIGQNCPLNYPAVDERGPPPTAELSGEQLTGQRRNCIYEQGDKSWPVGVPSSQSCPLFAGMADSSAAAAWKLSDSGSYTLTDDLREHSTDR
jgi:hypothetical protein